MVRATRLSGRYALEERLASGGMGAVYAATDERLSRRVAVKLLREELADDPRFVERFKREARAVAALSHPNIANVFDYGEDEDHHYIVMELAAGRDLSRTLREEGPLDPQAAAAIAAQTCDALAHAHGAGVIHRDIKPGNIIVDDNRRVKVTDFGIARAAGQSTLTATGSVIGTAQYLSPEQGSGAEVGPQSDLYSLGIVLYEMLTGSVPFSGDTPIAIAMKHVAEEVPAPSSVNPDVPRELDAVVAKATAKAPEDRFSSASSMAEALRAATSATPRTALLGAGAAAAGSTAVLDQNPASEEATRHMAPVAGERPVRTKLARVAAMLLGVLAVVLLAVLLYRVATGDDPTNGRTTRRQAGGRVNQPQGDQQHQDDGSQAPSFVIPEGIVGQSADDAEHFLEDRGFEVDEEDVASTAEKDTVVNTIPAPGNPAPGTGVITLVVSTGEAADEGDTDGDTDEDSSGHGNSDEAPGNSDKAKEPKEDKDKEEGD